MTNDHGAPAVSAPEPVRVQRKRSKGWRMPDNTVYVGRPTIWGNPHPGSRWDDDEWEFGPFPTWEACAAECYRLWLGDDPKFMAWLRGTVWGAASGALGDPERAEILRRLPELRGFNLACWCPLDCACHADVLLRLANATAGAQEAKRPAAQGRQGEG